MPASITPPTPYILLYSNRLCKISWFIYAFSATRKKGFRANTKPNNFTKLVFFFFLLLHVRDTKYLERLATYYTDLYRNPV